MNKNIKTLKRRVSQDFNATLHTYIRSSSTNNLSFEKAEERKDFNTLKSQNGNQSIQSISSKNYDMTVNITITKDYEIAGKEKLQNEIKKNIKEKSKVSTVKYFQRFFPTFSSLNVPFERTSVQSLPYHLHIELENDEKIFLKVTEFYKIIKIKSKIYKRKNIPIEQQAIFYNGKQLEGENMLYKYGIRSNSKLQMKMCIPINIFGIFDVRRFPLTIYTSKTILEVKESFATLIKNIDSFDIELQYNGVHMEDNNEIFLYNVKRNSEIEILLSDKKENTKKSPGYLVVNKFMKMTDDLKRCKCYELRIQTMADLCRLVLDYPYPQEELDMKSKFLLEFDKAKNFHHFLCFKLKSFENLESDCSKCSSVSDFVSTSFSGSESSLKSVVWAESKIVDRHNSLKIEREYIILLTESDDFKLFKHLLKDKVGTKCNLRSVALLYKYAKAIVRFLGFKENENNPQVDKIICFINMYFEKYFKKDIIRRGGMDALTLSGSDID